VSALQVVGLAAAYSAAFSVVFAAVLVGGTLVAADAMVQDYPPAIRDRYGPKSDRGRRVTRVMGAGAGLLLLAVCIAAPLHLTRLDPGAGFWAGFLFGSAFVLVLHLVDLLVFDWLVFCTIRPRFVVLPGTEDMAEYRDYGFHLRVLFPRPVPWPVLLIPAFGLVLGGLTALARILG
jgi:hypothetical protein